MYSQDNRQEGGEGLVCPHCHNDKEIVEVSETGEMVCKECGTVISINNLDLRKDEIIYPEDLEKGVDLGRWGPPNLPTYPMGSKIGYSVSRKSEERDKMDRLRKWGSGESKKYRKLSKISSHISRIATSLNLPRVTVDDACTNLRRAYNQDLCITRSDMSLAIALLYISTRERHIPRRLKEFLQYSDCSRAYTQGIIRKLILGLEITLPYQDYVNYLEGFAERLRVDTSTRERAKIILKRANEQGLLAGKDPISYAAAALYKASLDSKSPLLQNYVATQAGVTEITLRNRLKDLESLSKKLDQL